jgi:hypothetical protein
MLDAGKDQGRVAMTQWLKEGSVVFIIQKIEKIDGRQFIRDQAPERHFYAERRRGRG